jgi:hypothetical protein
MQKQYCKKGVNTVNLVSQNTLLTLNINQAYNGFAKYERICQTVCKKMNIIFQFELLNMNLFKLIILRRFAARRKLDVFNDV